jgi:hypothetical protein
MLLTLSHAGLYQPKLQTQSPPQAYRAQRPYESLNMRTTARIQAMLQICAGGYLDLTACQMQSPKATC